MENYKIQIKLSKEYVPSFLQYFNEVDIWNAVLKAIENGNAEIILVEPDSDFESFSIPTEVKNIQEDWVTDFNGDLYFQCDFFLENDEAQNKEFILQKFFGLLTKSNLLLYSYFFQGDLYQSYGYIDDSDVFTDYNE